MDLADYRVNPATNHFWHRSRLELIDYLAGQAGPAANIAAVGCGTGEELIALSKFGSVIGYDKQARALKPVADFDFELQQHDIEQSPLPVASDVVAVFDVLEHIADDHRALINLARSLKANGKLLITVPAYPWLMSSHDEALGHYRRYSRSVLRRRLSEAGFCLESCGYWNALLAPAIIIFRLLKKLLPPKTKQSEAAALPKIINTLGRLILTSEVIWLRFGGRLPWGISLYAIARKPTTNNIK